MVTNKNLLIRGESSIYLNFNKKIKLKQDSYGVTYLFGHHFIHRYLNSIEVTNILTKKQFQFKLIDLIGAPDIVMNIAYLLIDKDKLVISIVYKCNNNKYELNLVYDYHFNCIHKKCYTLDDGIFRIEQIYLENKMYSIYQYSDAARILDLENYKIKFDISGEWPFTTGYNDIYYYHGYYKDDIFYIDAITLNKKELKKLEKYSNYEKPFLVNDMIVGYTFKFTRNQMGFIMSNNNYIFICPNNPNHTFVYTKYFKYVKTIPERLYYVDETNLVTWKDDAYIIYNLRKIKKRKSYLDITKNTQYWHIWRLFYF